LYEGADFELVISRDSENRVSYDNSQFDRPKQLFDDEKEMEDVYNAQHSLHDYLHNDLEWLSQEALDAKFNEMLGTSKPASKRNIPEDISADVDELLDAKDELDGEDEQEPDTTPPPAKAPAKAPAKPASVAKKPAPTKKKEVEPEPTDDVDSEFDRMVNGK